MHVTWLSRRAQSIPCGIVLASLVAMAGCQAFKQSSYRDKPEADWNQMRSRIKAQLAQKQLDSGLFEDAVRSASESISMDGKTPDAYVTLARANIELNKLVAAQQALDAASTRGIRSGDLSYAEGILLEQRHQLEKAILKYGEAESFNRNSVDYFIAHIECLISLQKLDEAQQLVREAENRFDDEKTLAILSARFAILRGDPEQIVQQFARARAAIADDPIMAESLGLTLLRLDRVDEAIAVLSPLARNPKGLQLGEAGRKGLAEALLRKGDCTQALEVLRESNNKQPMDAAGQVMIAQAALCMNDFATSLNALDRAERTTGAGRDTSLLRATVYWKRGDSAVAVKLLEERTSADATDGEALCLLAEIALSEKRVADARTYFVRAQDASPNLRWAHEGMKLIDQAQ